MGKQKKGRLKAALYFLVFGDQVLGSHLAVTSRNEVEGYLLAFVQSGKA